MSAGGASIQPDHRNLALLAAGTLFIEMMDGTIVTTSAPKIAHALGVSVGSIGLVITAYLITQAVLIPLSGWVTARIGGRRTFIGAIIVFMLGSAGCAASATLPELVAMRVLQGVGGAMMVPVGRTLVFSRANPANLLRVTAMLVWPGLVAPVLAPLIGGVITTDANWHWLFLVNLPLGVIAVAVGLRVVHPPPFDDPGRLDLTGVLLTCTGLAGLTLAADLLAGAKVRWALALALGIPATLLLTLAWRHLRGVRNPLVSLSLLRIPTFRTVLTGTALYTTVTNASPFLAPLMFEQVFHWGAIKAGSVVLFIFVGNIAVKPATTYLYSRFGFRRMLLAATLTMAAGLVLVGLTSSASPLLLIGVLMILIGVARSVGATGQMTVIYADVPAPEMRHASTLQATVQQLAAGTGVAASAIALRLGRPLGWMLAGGPSLHTDYSIAFVIIACVALLASLNVLRLAPGVGDALRVGAGARRSAAG
ncbi:MAG: MFS transporter [Solirubrobacteraceae bacterium]